MYFPSVNNICLAPLSIAPTLILSNRKDSNQLATQVQWKGKQLNKKQNIICTLILQPFQPQVFLCLQ